MIKVLTALLLFLIMVETQACFIRTYGNIIKVKDAVNYQEAIKETNCNKKEKNIFLNFIKENSGSFTKAQLNRYISKKFTIEPTNININNIDEYTLKALKDQEYRISETKLIGEAHNFYFNDENSLSIECSNCSTTGNVNVKFTNTGNQKVIWASAKLEKATMALVALNDIPFVKKQLFMQNFKVERIYTTNPADVFKDFNQIHFYKMNKNIAKDSVIKISDLTSNYLVTIGHPVQVTYKGTGVTLSTSATAMRSGRIGEVIQLKAKNNKKIFAKVTGYNKAKIEL